MSKNFYYFSKQHHAHAEAAIEMYFEKPIFGVGPKNFRKVCPNKIYSSKFACTSHPHNTFLQLLAETGLLGSLIPLFLLISIIIYYCKNLFKLFSKKKDEIHLPKIILIGCFFITLFPFLPSGNFFTNHLNIIFYLPLGFFMYEFDRFFEKMIIYSLVILMTIFILYLIRLNIYKIYNVYDHPDKLRKLHKNKTSLCGGLFIFISVLFFYIQQFFLKKYLETPIFISLKKN